MGIDENYIVGSYTEPGFPNPENVLEHGFIYDTTTQRWSTLDMPGATWTEICDIDGSNIVGLGFLYNKSTNTWTPLNMPGVRTTYAQAIDADKVVGYYIDEAMHSHGFIYTIPEPCSILLLTAGLAFIRKSYIR
jgi:hypothetical protein